MQGRRSDGASGTNATAHLVAAPTEAFVRWCAGNTGHPFVDAGLRELAATGYLSNRMRQVVASYPALTGDGTLVVGDTGGTLTAYGR